MNIFEKINQNSSKSGSVDDLVNVFVHLLPTQTLSKRN